MWLNGVDLKIVGALLLLVDILVGCPPAYVLFYHKSGLCN